MKKQDVYVVVDTKKKARKLKKVLDMFGEHYSPSFVSNKIVMMCRVPFTEFEKHWESFKEVYMNKTKVSINQLRNILAREHLKKGDIVFYNHKDGNKFVGDVDKVMISDNLRLQVMCKKYLQNGEKGNLAGFAGFTRYETKEEIALLKPTTLKVGKWYKYPNIDNWMVCVTSNDDRGISGYGFNVCSEWMVGSWGYEYDELHELIPVPNEEVSKALINEAKKRYKVGDKLNAVRKDNSRGKRIFSHDLKAEFLNDKTSLYIINDECLDGFSWGSCIFRCGKWADVVESELNLTCKFWDYDPSKFVVSIFDSYSFEYEYKFRDHLGTRYKNCKPIDPNMTLEEVFGKEVTSNEKDKI